MSKQGHQPERFDAFTELKDGSGFTIAGCKHVFKYDKHGGWFDEYGNYYDRDGNPEDPPSDGPYSDQDEHSSCKSDAEEDQFEREFGRPKDYDEEEEHTGHSRHLQKIASNILILNGYPNNEPLRVHFKGISYFSKREQVYNHFKGYVKGIINLIFDTNEKGQFNGKGYFVVDSPQAGEQLIGLQGEKVGDREISFELDDVEDFILDPIEPKELNCDLGKGSKKYVKKEAVKQEPPSKNETKPKVQQQIKVEAPPSQSKPKVQEKKEQKKVQAKVEQKKENPEDFASYTFLKKAFPKKSSFKDWLAQNKFTQNDYKTVEKIVGNEDYAKISMKKKVYNALNNSFYNGQKVVFKPQ